MKKYLVVRTREGRESSFDFDTPGEVASFLAGAPAEHYTVFVRVDGLTFGNPTHMHRELSDVEVETHAGQI